MLNFFKSRTSRTRLSPPRPRPLRALDPASTAASPAKLISEAKLREIMANDDLALAGRAQLITLSMIKTRLGERWAALRDRIFPVFSNSFERRFGTRESVYKKSEIEYVVIFSGQLAAAKKPADMTDMCRTVLQEVGRKFTGDYAPGTEDVKTIFGYDGEVFAFTPEDREKLKARAETAETGENAVDPAGLFVSGETFDIAYRPLWDARHQSITTYAVHARSSAADGRQRHDYNVLRDKTSLESRIGLDWMLLDEAVETMKGLYENRFRTLYAVPVSYETLFSRDRLGAYLGRCRKIPEELRKYIIFNLTLCPAGVPVTKLQMIAGGLKPYGHSLQIDLGTPRADLEKYTLPGLSRVHYRLPGILKDPRRLWMNLAELSLKCRQLDLKLVIGNVNSREHGLLAREIGANFISGDIIGAYCDMPEHMQRLTWQEIIGPSQ